MASVIEQIDILSLSPWTRSARTHSKKQIRQLAESLETFGFTNPVLIDRHNTILAGHGRVQAAKQLGVSDVPCVRLGHMTPEQKRANVLADNKLALKAGWDEDLLAAELGALLSGDFDFDIDVTGFSIAEIDLLVEGQSPTEDGDPADDLLPDMNALSARCRHGDAWRLGPHRLVCRDALDPETVDVLMEGHVARMVFTGPPYNVAIDGHVGGSGQVKYREFAMTSGEMSTPEFTAFLRRAFENLVRHSLDGSIHHICMDRRHLREMLDAGNATYAELKNLIVWAKDNGGMGSFYRSRHQLIFAFKHGTAPHLNSFELGQHGRYRTNVWQ